MNKYADYALAKEVTDYMLTKNPQRIFVEGNVIQMNRLGSPHAMMTNLNRAGQGTINGLLKESSSQSEFLTAIFYNISHTMIWNFNQRSLIHDSGLLFQFQENYNRLRLFGVDYLVVHSNDAIDQLSFLARKGKIKEIARFGYTPPQATRWDEHTESRYHIYRFINPIPLVRSPENHIGLYVDTALGSSHRFKKLSTEFFRHPDTYNLPVAFTRNFSQITPQELYAFDYFIIPAHEVKNQALINRLQNTGNPILIYKHFNNSFRRELALIHKERSAPNAKIINFENELVRFQPNVPSAAPWIINLGYFPNWRSDRTIFEVTPRQMLVWSHGEEEINIHFGKGTIQYVAGAISLLALLGLPFYAKFIKRKFKLSQA